MKPSSTEPSANQVTLEFESEAAAKDFKGLVEKTREQKSGTSAVYIRLLVNYLSQSKTR